MTTAAARASDLSRQLDEVIQTINARTFRHLAPTRAAVSTMTITASLNVRRVCRDSMMIALSLVEGDGPLLASEAKTHKRKRSSVFFNQITMRHGTKSVKVFYNGSMHVTGCTSPAEFWEVATAVCNFMSDTVAPQTTDGSEVVCIQGFDVQMINVNFGAGMELYLKGLRDTCAALGYMASYDADTYPGLNVKLPIGERHVTVLLFKSGKVIITGAKTAAELDTAHRMITDVLDAVDAQK